MNTITPEEYKKLMSPDNNSGFNLSNTVGQLFSGFVEGFTTLPVNDWMNTRPKNTVEKISYQLGNLLGFVGYLPGFGQAAKLGGVALAKTIGLVFKSEKAVGLGLKAIKVANKIDGLKSVPMLFAGGFMKGMEKTGVKAALEATSFLKKSPVMADMLFQGIHLGVASAVGSAPIYDVNWETTVDKRFSGFKQGFLYGVGNAAIGNLFSRGGKLDLGSIYVKKTPAELMELAKTNPKVAQGIFESADKVNKIARITSSAIAFGLPSTLENQPLELQIYEYLLNGYFGGKEMSIHQKKALEIMKPFAANSAFRGMLLRPEEHIKGFNELNPEVKLEIKKNALIELGGTINRFSTSEYAILDAITNTSMRIKQDLEDGKINEAQKTDYENALIIHELLIDKLSKETEPEKELTEEEANNKDLSIMEDVMEKASIVIADRAAEKYNHAMNTNKSLGVFGDVLKASEHASELENIRAYQDSYLDLENYYKEKGMNYYKNTFAELAKMINDSKGQDNLLDEFSVEKELVSIGAKYLNKKEGGLNQEQFRKTVAQRFDIKIEDNPKIDEFVNRAYIKLKNAVPRLEYVITADNSGNMFIKDAPEKRANGSKWVVTKEPASQMTKILGNTFREIKTVLLKGKEVPVQDYLSTRKKTEFKEVKDKKTGKSKKIKLVKDIPVQETTVSLVETLYSKNLAVYSGKKADSNIFTGKLLVDKKNADNILAKLLDPKYIGKYKIEGIIDNYHKGLEEWKNFNGKESTYNHLFINNIELIRRFNFSHITSPGKVLAELSTGHFVFNPIALNKRMQLFGAFEPTVIPEDLKKVAGDKLNEKARVIILNAVNKDGSYHGNFDINYNYWINKNNENTTKQTTYNWGRTSDNSYEVSTQGDKRFSAFNARIKSKGNKSIEELYQTEVKGYKTVAEGKGKRPIDRTSEKPVAKIPMKFADGTSGNEMRPEYKGKSTMDLILSGHRTATSRDMKKDYNRIDFKIGDIVEFYDGNGKKVLAKITTSPKSLKEIDREEWSKKEGWSPKVYDKLVKKSGHYQQYEYKLLKEKTQEQTYQEYKDLWKLWAKENPNLIEELKIKANGKTLTDKFANTTTNQARALAEILSESKNINNEIVKKKSEAQLDGGVMVRQSVYEAMAKHGGLDINSGSMKGLTIQKGKKDNLGGFFSKHALHIADDVLNKWMEENNVDFVMFDTTAKQRGKRTAHDFWVDNSGQINFNRTKDGNTTTENPNIYELDWDSFTLASSEDTSKQNHSLKVPKQLGNQIEDPALREIYYEHIVKKNLEGDIAENKRASEFLNGKEITDLNIKKLGLGQKLKILQSPKASRYKNEIIKEVLSRRFDYENFKDSYFDGVYDEDTGDFLKEMFKNQGMVNKILQTAELNPTLLRLPGVDRFWESSLINWALGHAVAPETKAASKSVIRPHPFSLFGSKYKLQKDSYMLSSGHRNDEIIYKGKKTTLGKLYDDGVRMDHLVLRVPADSKAGIRKLKFAGFVDEVKGLGIYLRPEDMTELGGADTDIDTAYSFYDMPEEILNYFESHKNQWMGSSGEYIDSKNPEVMERLLSNKQTNFYPFSPLSNLIANNFAYKGNSLLGFGLATSNRIRTFFLRAMYNGDNKITFIDEKNKQIWKAEIDINKYKQFEETTRAIINAAADSADGINLKTANEVREELFKSIFKDGERVGEIANVPALQDMAKLDSLLKNKDYSNKGKNGLAKGYTLETFSEVLNNYSQKIPFENFTYETLNRLGSYDFSKARIEWRGNDEATIKAIKYLDELFYTNNNKEFGTILNTLSQEATGRALRISTTSYKNEQMTDARKDEFFRNDLLDGTSGLFIIDKYNKLVGYQDEAGIGLPEYDGVDGYTKDMAAGLKDLSAFYHNAIMEDSLLRNGLYVDEFGKVKYDELTGKKKKSDTTVVDALMKEVFDNPEAIDESVVKYLEKHVSDLSFLDKTLPSEAKEYLQSLLISSIKPTKTTYADIKKKEELKYKALEKIRTFAGLEDIGLKEVEKRLNELKSLVTFNNDQKRMIYLAETLKDKVDAAKKDWYQTTTTLEAMNKDFIDATIIREYTDMFRDVANITYQFENPDFNGEINKRLEIEDGLVNGEVIESISPDIANDEVAIKKLTEEISPIAETALPRNKMVRDLTVDSLVELEKAYEEESLSIVDADIKKAQNDLQELLYKNPHLLPVLQDMYIQWGSDNFDTPKTFSDMTKPEFLAFVNTLKQNHENIDGGLKLEKRHYMWKPEWIADEHNKYDSKTFMNVNSKIFDTKTKTALEATLRVPFSWGKQFVSAGKQGMRAIETGLDEAKKFVADSKITRILDGINNNYDRQLLWEYAQASREVSQFPDIDKVSDAQRKAYVEPYLKLQELIKEKGLLEKDYNLNIDNANKAYKGQELVDQIMTESTNEMKTIWEDYVLGAVRKAEKVITNFGFRLGEAESVLQERLKNYTAKTYMERYGVKYDPAMPNWIDVNKLMADYRRALQNKSSWNNLGENIKDYIAHMMRLDELVVNINYKKDKYKLEVNGRIGDLPFNKKIEVLNHLWNQSKEVAARDERGEVKFDENGEAIMNRVYTHRQTLEFIPKTEMREEYYQSYFPHLDLPGKEKEKYLERKLAETNDQSEKAKLIVKMNRFGTDAELTSSIEEILGGFETGITADKINEINLRRNANLMSRDSNDPIPGWNRNRSVISTYTEGLQKSYHGSMLSLVLHDTISNFERNGNKSAIGEKNIKYWAGFFRASARNIVGFPATYPVEWTTDPGYKLKGNPYRLLTESYYAEKATILDKFFGITKEMRREPVAKKTKLSIEKILDLPEFDNFLIANKIDISDAEKKEYKGIKNGSIKPHKTTYTAKLMTKVEDAVSKFPLKDKYSTSETEKVDVYKGVRETLVSRKLASLANADGKWNLISLLSHPKTAMTNLLGSYSNTLASTGLSYVTKSHSSAFLKRIKPEWGDKSALDADIDSVGGMENYFKYEMGLSQKFNAENTKRFMQRAIETIKKDANASDITIYEIAKQEGLTKAFVDKAAYFIKKSERIARRTAWLSHYLKAREVLEATTSTFEWNDAWLVAMANKGVEATQFLYHNAARPEFMRTNLGKIVGRFQMFALGSIDFRRETARKAKMLGYMKGSEEHNRLVRLQSLDMMTLALASALPFSIFNTVLPAPLNYISDLAAFFLGNKDEKERAFFGVLPYPANIVQPLLPPSTRLVTGALNMLLSGDTEKFFSYTMWTAFPYGRLMNDVRKLAKNPEFTIDRLTGIPFKSLSINIKKSNDKRKAKKNRKFKIIQSN